jgi:hypothetical protein
MICSLDGSLARCAACRQPFEGHPVVVLLEVRELRGKDDDAIGDGLTCKPHVMCMLHALHMSNGTLSASC